MKKPLEFESKENRALEAHKWREEKENALSQEIKIDQLSSQIDKARDAYYNSADPIMSDAEFDQLIEELEALDPTNHSITDIGAENPASSEWKKVKHLFPLGSLNKVNTPEEMNKWIKESAKNSPIFLTEKLDGLSLGCQYQDGKLIHAILRGGGSGEGECILSNAIKMKGCIQNIPGFTGVLRGEIMLMKQDHQQHFPDYSNPRNASSGLCRRFDGEGAEHLTLMFYQVLGQEFKTEAEQCTFLKAAGAIMPNYFLCRSAEEVSQTWQEYQDKTRASLDYEIDGLVASIDDMRLQISLGVSNLRPKGKLAYKFPNQLVKTTVKEIIWSTGSMGRCVPVCWVEPVAILGSTVQKASIYNIAYLNKLGLDVGAEISLTKCGEIIPRIERVIKGTGTTAIAPIQCPSCQTSLEMDGEYLICPNTQGCPAQIIGRIANWVKELDLLELGDTLMEKLVENGLVKDVSDLYLLKVKDLEKLPRMGRKSAENVHKSIWSKKEITLDIMLGGLSIPLIGSTSIRLLMDAGYDTLEKVMAMTQAEMQAIKGMGSARSESLVNGLLNNKSIITALLANGVSLKQKEEKKMDGKLSGKTFVMTGTLSMKRDEVSALIEEAGGTVQGSVSKTTQFLIIADPDSQSSKAVKARKMNVKCIDETTLMSMLNA